MTYQQEAPEAGLAEQTIPSSLEHQGSGGAVSVPPVTGSVRLGHPDDRAMITELVAQGKADREEIANLKKALETSRQIGAAIGVIMARHKVTDVQAFDLLCKKSQTTHRKLRDVAADVVLTGTLATE